MHQVNIGKIQEPFSPNFEICFNPDYYLMHSHILATYHIRAAALGNPQVVVQCSEDAGAGVVLASLWEWPMYPEERKINPINTKPVLYFESTHVNHNQCIDLRTTWKQNIRYFINP